MHPTLRQLRNLTVASAIAVGAVSSVALISGASPSIPEPTPGNPGHNDPTHQRVQPHHPPRYIGVVGPNGRPVVDGNGVPITVDTDHEGGDRSHGQTPLDAAGDGGASAAGGTPGVTVVRPYDTSRYHER